MSETSDWAAGELSRIESADPSQVNSLCDSLFQETCEPGGYLDSAGTDWTEIIRLLAPVLARRPDLRRTSLLELLDTVAMAPYFPEPPGEPICAAIRGEVRASLDLWRKRFVNPSEPGESRASALGVLSHYEPESAAVRSGAASFLREFSPDSPDWCAVFDAARRVLARTGEWKTLVLELEARIEAGGAFGAKVNPPLPRPEVCVLIAALADHDGPSREKIYRRLQRFDAREMTSEALYLPAPLRAEVMSRVVPRINAESKWIDLGAFAEIYYLLQAFFEHGPPEPRYTARTGRVDYEAIRPPASRPAGADAFLLRPILDCPRLWEVDTNLLAIFGLPQARADFGAWLGEQLSSK